jgi:hypothetical protein
VRGALITFAAVSLFAANSPAWASQLNDAQLDAVSGGYICDCVPSPPMGSAEWLNSQTPVIANRWSIAIDNWSAGTATIPAPAFPVVEILQFGNSPYRLSVN